MFIKICLDPSAVRKLQILCIILDTLVAMVFVWPLFHQIEQLLAFKIGLLAEEMSYNIGLAQDKINDENIDTEKL